MYIVLGSFVDFHAIDFFQEFEQMFFCNTCNQPLCEACREETHRAKMFARHDIVVLSKRTKEIHRECGNKLLSLIRQKFITMYCETCLNEN